MASRPRNRRTVRPRRRPLTLLLATAAVLAAAAGAYVAAKDTSIFALRHIEVEGATPAVAARVQARLRPYLGRSLVRFDPSSAGRLLSGVTEIADTRFDRDFPHTLKVRVRLERPIAVLRRGEEAWLVAASDRVLRRLVRRPYPALPRIWLPRSADVVVGSPLGGPVAAGIAALLPLGAVRLPAHVRQVLVGEGQLTLVLGSGAQIRLGGPGDLRLKLAIAKQLLPLTAGARYLDVSVPERPVSGPNPQLGG